MACRNLHPEWTAELQFRATGLERGSGNLQLWYAKNGKANVGMSSVYTVGTFEGFVLVVDSHKGFVSWKKGEEAIYCTGLTFFFFFFFSSREVSEASSTMAQRIIKVTVLSTAWLSGIVNIRIGTLDDRQL